MMNDECGMMNDELKTSRLLSFNSSFITLHSAFLILPILSIPVKLNFRPLEQPEPAERAAKQRLRGDEEDDDCLEHLDQVFCDVLGERIDEDAAADQHAEEQRYKGLELKIAGFIRMRFPRFDQRLIWAS